MSYQIRPEIILAYCQATGESQRKQFVILAERDREFRALNTEFQYAQSDGTYSSSHARRRDANYDVRYRQINEVFQAEYEGEVDRKLGWRKTLNLTIYEFLFLDNFYDHLLRELCSSSTFSNGYSSQLIRMKAEILMGYWKAKWRVDGIQNRMQFEFSDFHYAAKRCRKFFNVGIFDFPAKSAIRKYEVDWTDALNGSFERQNLG